jgi:hypothetical protein
MKKSVHFVGSYYCTHVYNNSWSKKPHHAETCSVSFILEAVKGKGIEIPLQALTDP